VKAKSNLPLLLGLGAAVALLYRKADEVERAVDPEKVVASIPERFFAKLNAAREGFEGADRIAEYERIRSELRGYLIEKGMAPTMADDWFKEWVAVNVGVHPNVEKPETEEDRTAALKQLANDILADMG